MGAWVGCKYHVVVDAFIPLRLSKVVLTYIDLVYVVACHLPSQCDEQFYQDGSQMGTTL